MRKDQHDSQRWSLRGADLDEARLGVFVNLSVRTPLLYAPGELNDQDEDIAEAEGVAVRGHRSYAPLVRPGQAQRGG